jgi:hypothetical protein
MCLFSDRLLAEAWDNSDARSCDPCTAGKRGDGLASGQVDAVNEGGLQVPLQPNWRITERMAWRDPQHG